MARKLLFMVLALMLVIVGCTGQQAATTGNVVKAPNTQIILDVDESDSEGGDTVSIDLVLTKNGFDPDMVKVNKGDTVYMNVRTPDQNRGIVLDAFGVDHRLPRNESVTIRFVADQKGVFEYQCSTYCGCDHEAMIGYIVVN